MKLKLDEKGAVVVQDGKPVYIHEDGKELPFDAAGALEKIKSLNGEAKSHREAKETAEAALKKFDGIDVAAARDAIEKIKKIDDKKLIDAGEVDKVRAEAVKATEEKYKPITEKADKLEKQLNDEIVGGAFSRSKYIGDKLAIPVDLVQAHFGKHFKVVDGKLNAVGYDGNPIYSRTRAGELANFDEAIESLVDGYAHKDAILKGSGGGGGGAKPGGPGAAKSISRAEFDALPPADRMAKIKEGVKPVD